MKLKPCMYCGQPPIYNASTYPHEIKCLCNKGKFCVCYCAQNDAIQTWNRMNTRARRKKQRKGKSK